MWRWQLKSLRSKKLDAWSRLFLLSLSAHLVFVFVMLFIYKGNSYHIDLTFNTRNLANATIVFMPLHKKIAQPLASGGSSSVVAQGTKLNQSSIQVKKTETATPVSVPKKITAEKAIQPATRLATTAAAPASKTKHKTQSKKNKNTNLKKTRQEAKKIEQKQPVEAQKKVVEKTEPKSPDEIKEQPKVPEAAPVNATPAGTGAANADLPATADQNIIYVGQEDLDALKLQQVIQQEIGTHFKPPAGLSKQLQCQLTLMVGFDGAVIDVMVHQSSGAAIFDMSARNAVSKLTLPAWTHGKELTITFNN